MTVHVRTSTIHEFSHSGLMRLSKKLEREKKKTKSVFAYSEGETINNSSQIGKLKHA